MIYSNYQISCQIMLLSNYNNNKIWSFSDVVNDKIIWKSILELLTSKFWALNEKNYTH